MRVTPISKEDADAGGVGEPFKAGDYDFMINAAEETTSTAGNEMLKLVLHVFNRDGEKRTVFDYILSSESGAWKARHMMDAIGMTKRYEQGIIDPYEIQGKPGRCKLKIEPAGQWPAKNTVVDYLGTKQAAETTAAPRARQPAPAAAGRTNDDLSDDIPF